MRGKVQKADYILALLGEIERLHPAPKHSRLRHGITRDESGDGLVLLVCVGDALWHHKIDPADLSDDPVETAARLVAQFDQMDDDPAHYW
jgi:hypothetical protein